MKSNELHYEETLLWILDKYDPDWISNEEAYRENIDFVHSLGLKCDCVGWCRMKLSPPHADEILSDIESFCKAENKWKVRGFYSRSYVDVQSDWYELVPEYFKGATVNGEVKLEGALGSEVTIANLRAYHEMKPTPKIWDVIYVPERFRNACLKLSVPGVDFCWAQDKGKYDAEQYFALYADARIAHIATDRELDKTPNECAPLLGGYLPRIADLFYWMQRIDLEDCYLSQDMPEGGIAYAYCPSTHSYSGRKKILIHKDTATALLQEKALPPSALRPAVIVDTAPAGYVLEETEPWDRAPLAYIRQSIADYEDFKKKERPTRAISDKEALKVLRCAKREQKDDFKRALPRSKVPEVEGTPYVPMIPYYLIANGGFLSDEYELLGYECALVETESFRQALQAEELLEEQPNGAVIAKCADGDTVLLCDNGHVLRFSHEEPVASEEWVSLASFFVDAIQDTP